MNYQHHKPHRFIAMAAYDLSERAIKKSLKEGEQIHLDMENFITIIGPVCIDCELPYNEVKWAPCHGNVHSFSDSGLDIHWRVPGSPE